jgi:hypothetical protein
MAAREPTANSQKCDAGVCHGPHTYVKRVPRLFCLDVLWRPSQRFLVREDLAMLERNG